MNAQLKQMGCRDCSTNPYIHLPLGLTTTGIRHENIQSSRTVHQAIFPVIFRFTVVPHGTIHISTLEPMFRGLYAI